MAYVYRSSSSQGNASGAGLTVTKPAGTVNGDLIIVVAYLETGSNTWSSVGAGFNRVPETPTAGTNLNVQMWWKWASGEPASWTWTPTATAWRTVVVASYSGGAGTGSIVDVHASAAAQAAIESAQTAPSVTTTVANDLLIYGYGNFGGNDFTATLGAATNVRVSLGGCSITDSTIASPGATGTTRPNSGLGSQDYAAIHSAFMIGSIPTPVIVPDFSLLPKKVILGVP